jgi:hypothetical protein
VVADRVHPHRPPRRRAAFFRTWNIAART